MSYEQDLSADVSENGDLKVVSMRELRDGFEFKRLGPNVTATISRHVEGVGLSHAPEDFQTIRMRTCWYFGGASPSATSSTQCLTPQKTGRRPRGPWSKTIPATLLTASGHSSVSDRPPVKSRYPLVTLAPVAVLHL